MYVKLIPKFEYNNVHKCNPQFKMIKIFIKIIPISVVNIIVDGKITSIKTESVFDENTGYEIQSAYPFIGAFNVFKIIRDQLNNGNLSDNIYPLSVNKHISNIYCQDSFVEIKDKYIIFGYHKPVMLEIEDKRDILGHYTISIEHNMNELIKFFNDIVKETDKYDSEYQQLSLIPDFVNHSIEALYYSKECNMYNIKQDYTMNDSYTEIRHMWHKNANDILYWLDNRNDNDCTFRNQDLILTINNNTFNFNTTRTAPTTKKCDCGIISCGYEIRQKMEIKNGPYPLDQLINILKEMINTRPIWSNDAPMYLNEHLNSIN